ncbi:hypothetical protein QL926_06960 [Pseudoalteromonas sp. APC 3213]|uniref:hypothetical protein n=1 Tax=Pseudoalteromonas sp. APC 3213 TaxID=3035178 RepID=UPI0025B39B54|nr:hypothetical protein [Pseudoalteromonas sp. APC 3213]MDN3401231.1 hypothetical protein [Pseudoalteromonas sp. APC 3213]
MIGFISIPIITHLMPPAELGKFGLMMSVSFILIPVISLCADSYLPVAKSKGKSFSNIKKSVYVLSFLLFLLSLVTTIIIIINNSLSWLLFLLPLFCWVRAIRVAQQSELIYDEKVNLFGMSNIGLSLLTLAFTAVFLKYISNDSYSRLLAILLAEFLILILCLKHVQSIKSSSFDSSEVKKIFKFSLPLLVSLFPAWIVNEYGKVFVSDNGTFAMVGILTVSLQISAFQLQINAAVYNAFLKIIYSDVNKVFSIKLFGSIMLILLFTTAMGAFFIYVLGEKFVSAEYKGFVSITLALLVGVYFQSMASLPALYANHVGLTPWRLSALCAGASVCLLFLHFYVNIGDGLMQVAYVYSFSMTTYFITLLLTTYVYHVKKNNY